MNITVNILGDPPVAFARVDDSPIVHELPVTCVADGYHVALDALIELANGEELVIRAHIAS